MRTARRAEECDELFAAFVRSGDLDGLLSLYEPDACLVQRDGTVVAGMDELRKTLSVLTAEPTEMRMHVLKVVGCGGLAAIYCEWTSTSTRADGSTRQSAGRAIEIVRQQPDGRWLFAIDDPFARSRGGHEL